MKIIKNQLEEFKLHTGQPLVNKTYIVTTTDGWWANDETFVNEPHTANRPVRRFYGISVKNWFFGIITFEEVIIEPVPDVILKSARERGV